MRTAMKPYGILILTLALTAALFTPARTQSITEDLQYRSEILIDEEAEDTTQTFFYPSGNKRSEGKLFMGNRHGEWTIWYDNTRIWMIGKYNNGQIEGRWKCWNDGLSVHYYLFEGQLQNGSRNGEWTFYYENGNTESQGVFLDEKLDGVWRYWYSGAQLKRVEGWANGIRNGKWEYWHVNGQQEREEEYNGGLKHGTWSFWYPNGNLERKESWQGGKMHGLWTFWYPSGQIEMQGTFVNDQAAGSWTVWYENGEKRMEGDLIADRQEDEWTFWYPNSNKKAIVKFKRGDVINVRLLRKPPVNTDRRPEIVGASATGSYSREAAMRLGEGMGGTIPSAGSVPPELQNPNGAPLDIQDKIGRSEKVVQPRQTGGFSQTSSSASSSTTQKVK